MPIPKKIHFIWIGGSSITEQDFKAMQELAVQAKKDGFEFNVWVDKESNLTDAAKKFASTTRAGDVAFSPEQMGMKVRPINELISNMEKDPFYQKNDRLRQFVRSVRREMIGSRNLAAAADFLRYEILRQEGGYYIDTDTRFILGNGAKLKPDDAPLGILVNGQVTGTLNNDVIAAEKNHPALQYTIEKCLSSYEFLDSEHHSSATFIQEKNEDKIELPQDATMMDAKRHPYSGTKDAKGDLNLVSAPRIWETLNASGPKSLAEGVKQFLQNLRKVKKDDPDFSYASAVKSVEISNPTAIANLKFNSGKAHTWFHKKKTMSRGYDDRNITSTIFGESKSKHEKTTKKETTPSPPKTTPVSKASSK